MGCGMLDNGGDGILWTVKRASDILCARGMLAQMGSRRRGDSVPRPKAAVVAGWGSVRSPAKVKADRRLLSRIIAVDGCDALYRHSGSSYAFSESPKKSLRLQVRL